MKLFFKKYYYDVSMLEKPSRYFGEWGSQTHADFLALMR